MFVQKYRFCLFNPFTFFIDDHLDFAVEAGIGLGKQGPFQLPGLQHDGVDQGGLNFVSGSVGVLFKLAPEKIADRIQVGGASEPFDLGDEVVGVGCQPFNGLLEHILIHTGQ